MMIILDKWKSYSWKIAVMGCMFNSFSASAQVEEKRSSFGFVLSAINDKLMSDNSQIQVKNNFGFGIGALYQREISRKISLSGQAYSYLSDHQVIYNEAVYKLNEKGIGIPVTLAYKMFNSNLSAFTGVEYLRLFNQKSPDILLEKNNFSGLLGLNYVIRFADFSIVPEIKYGMGFENSIQDISLKNYAAETSGKRSTVTFTIKLM